MLLLLLLAADACESEHLWVFENRFTGTGCEL
jgi:hypothetical protein